MRGRRDHKYSNADSTALPRLTKSSMFLGQGKDSLHRCGKYRQLVRIELFAFQSVLEIPEPHIGMHEGGGQLIEDGLWTDVMQQD